MPANEIPSFVISRAIEKKIANNWLVKTWGGLGDIVCAEPTLRFILKKMPEIRLTIQTAYPELFQHLKLYSDSLMIVSDRTPLDESGYYVTHTIKRQDTLAWEFISHSLIQPVDYISINVLRMQLPIEDRQINLPFCSSAVNSELFITNPEEYIVVHPGKHWPSKTFPADWWSTFTKALTKYYGVILVGKTVDENVGFVNFQAPKGAFDYRDDPRFKLKDLIAYLTHAKFVFTNDSSPLHIASAGNAKIAFIASCKHPDYLYHWRNGFWAWRMRDFGKDNLFHYLNVNPVQENTVLFDECPKEIMSRILPDPTETAKNVWEWNWSTRHASS